MNNWKLKFKKIPFAISSRNIEHLGINLVKYMKDIYTDKLLLNYFFKSAN